MESQAKKRDLGSPEVPFLELRSAYSLLAIIEASSTVRLL